MDDEVQRDRLQYVLRASSPPPPGYPAGPAPDCFDEVMQRDWAEAERLTSRLLGP